MGLPCSAPLSAFRCSCPGTCISKDVRMWTPFHRSLPTCGFPWLGGAIHTRVARRWLQTVIAMNLAAACTALHFPLIDKCKLLRGPLSQGECATWSLSLASSRISAINLLHCLGKSRSRPKLQKILRLSHDPLPALRIFRIFPEIPLCSCTCQNVWVGGCVASKCMQNT